MYIYVYITLYMPRDHLHQEYVTTLGLGCTIYIFEQTQSLNKSYSTNFFLCIWFQYFSSVPVAPHTNELKNINQIALGNMKTEVWLILCLATQ